MSLALLQSSSCLRRPAVTRAPSVGSPTSSRHQSGESTHGEHPKLAFVPSSAFRTLPTACSSLDLADLFHPAATSRFLAPGGSSPDPSVTTSSVALAFAPLAPPPVAGYPSTPESVTSTSRPAPGRDPQRRPRCYPLPPPVSPHALLLLRARFVSLGCAVDAPSARGLGPPVLAVPRTTNPQRLDRLTASMLYP